MTETPPNPPAFPRDERYLGHNGMTLRDYFAGQVLQGASNFITPPLDMDYEDFHKDCADAARYFYAIADAMLRERAK